MPKLFKPEISKIIKKTQKKNCHIKFCNKVIELTNLAGVLRNGNIEAEFHKISVKFVTQTIVS